MKTQPTLKITLEATEIKQALVEFILRQPGIQPGVGYAMNIYDNRNSGGKPTAHIDIFPESPVEVAEVTKVETRIPKG